MNLKDNILDVSSKKSANEKETCLHNDANDTKEIAPTKAAKDFSNRQDVVNKASLRHLKKFYVDIFKHDNLKLVRSRFCNLKSSSIIKLKFKSNSKNYTLMF